MRNSRCLPLLFLTVLCAGTISQVSQAQVEWTVEGEFRDLGGDVLGIAGESFSYTLTFDDTSVWTDVGGNLFAPTAGSVASITGGNTLELKSSTPAARWAVAIDAGGFAAFASRPGEGVGINSNMDFVVNGNETLMLLGTQGNTIPVPNYPTAGQVLTADQISPAFFDSMILSNPADPFGSQWYDVVGGTVSVVDTSLPPKGPEPARPSPEGAISINFVGDQGIPVPAEDGWGFPDGEYGKNTNNVLGTSGSDISLNDATGEATGVTLDFNSASAGVANYGVPNLNTDSVAEIMRNGAVGDQGGTEEVWSGFVRANSSFGSTGQQVEITLEGLSEKYEDYDVFVYFGGTTDQGDQYSVLFDDGNTQIEETPLIPTPVVESQLTGGDGRRGGRSRGAFNGYDDNLSLIGDVTRNQFLDSRLVGDRNDTVASTADGGLFRALSGDTLQITITDTNNNANGNSAFTPDPRFGLPTGLGGTNFGPNADLGVVGIQIIGTPRAQRIIPEPSTLALLTVAGGALLLPRRRAK